MKSKKLPYMDFYVGDWKRDQGVQSLDFFDRHVWFEMLMLMHDSEERGVLILKGKPMAEEQIARLLGLDNQTFNQSLKRLIEAGVPSVREEDNAIYCRRMVKKEELSKLRKSVGTLGGNPNLVNQKSKLGKPNTQPNADIDIDNDSDNEIENNIKEKKPKQKPLMSLSDASDLQIPESISSDAHIRAIERLLEYKIKIKKPYKHQDSFQTFLNRWAKRPDELIEAIEQTISNQWQGVVWEKNYNQKPNFRKTMNQQLQDIAEM